VTVQTYWPLLVLLAIPFLWQVQQRTRMDLTRKHLQLSVAVRSMVVVLLALALMQPVAFRSGPWVSVAYILDVSKSVSPSAVQNAIKWIQQVNASGNPASARFVPFGANAAVLDTVNELRTISVAEGARNGSIDQSGTNIEAAVDSALQTFSPHHLKRMVLVTDGNENAGHVTSLLTRLKAEGVRVYTVPLDARLNRDAWIEGVMSPSEIEPEALFPVEAHVYSQADTAGEVQLRYGDKSLASRKVHLTPGMNRVAFETSIKDESGPVSIEAEVNIPNDSFADNNKFRNSIVVKGLPTILYAEGHAESARYLESALKMDGFVVKTTGPSEVPSSVGELDAYDAIVLSDILPSSLSPQQMRAIATYVQDLGGGLIFAGGENVYGESGYSKTDIEKVLPITFDAKRPPQSIAMIVVLDKSGSMGTLEMALAREATKAPLSVLRDKDHFGVVAFDSNFYWAVPLQTASNRESIKTAINKILAGGETNAYPALEAAYNQLLNDPSELKHVILESDGHSTSAPFQDLATKMAQSKITVSTVALGAGADDVLLGKIAGWGRGRSYLVADVASVPQVFSKEAEEATGNTLREQSFKPVVKKNVQLFKGIDFKTAPDLLGYVATKPKDTSEVLLEAPERKDPLLAQWQYGLGKTAAFTSDVKDRWAVDWLQWSGYPKFWSQLVRQTMRMRDDRGVDLNVARDRDTAKITINAIDNELKSQLRVVRPDESVGDVPVHQAGPGSYEAVVPLKEKGSYLFRLVGQGGGASKTITYSYPNEDDFYPPDTALLKAISNETKGQFQPDPDDIFNSDGETTSLPVPLWPYLVGMALVLYEIDVLLRRVRLFE
jgi:Ca-activated chloride channel homolog